MPLTTSQRWSRYLAGGKAHLTPRQNRRIRHKANKMLGQTTGHSVTYEVIDEAPCCPTCGQYGDLPCLTSGGKVASRRHKGRD